MPDPTKRTGSLETVKDKDRRPLHWPSGHPKYCGRVRWPDGSRPRRHVPEKYCYSEDRAREYLASIQEDIDANRDELLEQTADASPAPADASPAADADAWVTAWLASKKARGQTSTEDRGGHYKHHIKAAVHAKHVKDWTAEDLRALVAALDAKIAAGELAAKTARNVWGTATKMCGDAFRSKLEVLRVRADNPAKDVEGPDRGDDRSKQFLYPSEFVQLVSCAEVPLRWRRAIALAVYLFPRAGELRALRWDDVDLVHGTVHVHQAFDRRARQVKSTKTKTSRRFTLEPEILPLLRAMHAEANGRGLVMPLPNRLASRLREWLGKAGLTRHELVDETSRTTKPLGFHDLRATGLTWMAVRGDEPMKIMQRAGHSDIATTMIYVRTAEAIGDAFGDVFPPLPPLVAPPPAAALPAISTGPLLDQRRASSRNHGAGHGIRTRDIQLGKLALYQLS